MSIKLPSKKGERVTVWEGFPDDAEGPTRVVVIGAAHGRWSMFTESATPADDDDLGAERWTDGDLYVWEDGGGAGADMLTRVVINMSLALRELAPFSLRPDATPREPVLVQDGAGATTVARMRGNRRLIVDCVGSDQAGDLIVGIRTNKPLDPGQWLAALQNLARALDAYNSERDSY